MIKRPHDYDNDDDDTVRHDRELERKEREREEARERLSSIFNGNIDDDAAFAVVVAGRLIPPKIEYKLLKQ